MMQEQTVKQNLIRLFETSEMSSVNLALQMLLGLLNAGEIELDNELKQTISICALKMAIQYRDELVKKRVPLGLRVNLVSILEKNLIGVSIFGNTEYNLFELDVTLVDAKRIIDSDNTPPNEVRFLNGASLLIHMEVINYIVAYRFANTWHWTYSINEKELLSLQNEY